MLEKLGVRNFKCFEDVILPLGPITLLTGFNAAGKSTTLQSLLLMTQSLCFANRSSILPLNGPMVELGTPGEVLNRDGENVSFIIEDNNVEVSWIAKALPRTKGQGLELQEVIVKDDSGIVKYTDLRELDMLLPPSVSEDALSLMKGLEEIIYISAVRAGNQDVFPSPDRPVPTPADVGKFGEYASWHFFQNMDEEVPPERCNPKDSAKTVRRQFNAWLGDLFPGGQANVVSVEQTNLFRLEFRIGDTEGWRRPSNVGYGLTYAFPIIVAGLLAKEGQVLIIDSPEAHLHPEGQSKMGYFLAQIAAAGVQVIIETHSDHLLNGLRIAVQSEIVSPSDVAVHFFSREEEENGGVKYNICSPLIDKEGNLSEWPEGFFDQSEKDLARLAGWQ